MSELRLELRQLRSEKEEAVHPWALLRRGAASEPNLAAELSRAEERPPSPALDALEALEFEAGEEDEFRWADAALFPLKLLWHLLAALVALFPAAAAARYAAASRSSADFLHRKTR